MLSADLGSGRKFEYDAALVSAAGGGRSKQIARAIKDEPRLGHHPVVVLDTEAMQDFFLALESEFEYDAGLVSAAGVGCSIQISSWAEHQPCKGERPISAVGLCTEAVEDSFCAFGSQFEYNTRSKSTDAAS